MSKRQNAIVLRLLQEHGTVSARDLLWHFGISRAAARIWELKKAGHLIETIPGRTLPDGTRQMASYRLTSDVSISAAASPPGAAAVMAAGSTARTGSLPEPVVLPRGSGRHLLAKAR